MRKNRYNLTIYLAYIFLFPLYLFGIIAKFYDKYTGKKSSKPSSHLIEKEDLHF